MDQNDEGNQGQEPIQFEPAAAARGHLSRRRFVGVLGAVGALGAVSVGVASCGATAKGESSSSSSDATNMSSAGSASGTMTADEMDAMHEAGMKAFPAKTEGLGGQPLAYTMDGDTKVFQLTVQKIHWETYPGNYVDGFGYNGVTPGPEIRVTEGDKVRIVVTNQLDQSTSVHWHGLMVPNAMDGVTYMTQPPIKPGASFTYEFVAKPAGTHMYHSHHNSTEQVGKGLLGPFIVEPKDPSTRPAFDREYTLVLNDGELGFSINGKGFPATQPLVAKQGERVLVRFMNEGTMIHPMHLHGMPMQVVAKDGWLQQPWLCDTLNIAPGDRWEVIVHATELGTWAFHCHILPHAESTHGMLGMVTALVVQ